MLQIFLKDVDMLQKGYYNSGVNKEVGVYDEKRTSK